MPELLENNRPRRRLVEHFRPAQPWERPANKATVEESGALLYRAPKRLSLTRMDAGGITIDVVRLGYQWGSVEKSNKVNIHWAAVQLPPALIDYVLVHELAHFQEITTPLRPGSSSAEPFRSMSDARTRSPRHGENLAA